MPDNWCKQTEKGLVVLTTPTLEEFGEFGATLNRIHNALPRMLGDWFNYGRDAFGEDVYQVIDELGYKRNTIWNYSSVYRRIPIENRDPELSHSHHTKVAALPPSEQMKWLEMAKHDPKEQRSLTATELEKRIKGLPLNSDDYPKYIKSALRAVDRLIEKAPNDTILGWCYQAKNYLEKCQENK